MPLLGKAAVAMWWDMAAEHRAEFEDWHSHEHFPERMGIPGFLRGARWADAEGGEGFFVMYELDDYATLTSPAYLERLNNPTPWSMKLMPHHSAMVRSQCAVMESTGVGVGLFALTVRMSPVTGREEELRTCLAKVAAKFAAQAGGVACHLLRTKTPEIEVTHEQKIRGGRDAVADWIVVATAYNREALESLQLGDLSGKNLQACGADAGLVFGVYQLAHVAAASDLS